MDYDVCNVLDRAVELRKDPRGHYGLCQTLRLSSLEPALVYEIFSSWEHFTGDMNYPVPAPSCVGYASVIEAAKVEYDTSIDMYSGGYGALRIELLDHLIAYLEGYLKDRAV